MKRKIRYSILLCLILCNVCGVCAQQSSKTDFDIEYYIPDVPESVTFAGETIDLTRYDMYERYERELTTVCYMHATTMLTIKRANRYMPVIVPILQRENIPTDFIYLVAIESAFNPLAVSPAKAAGMWQFTTLARRSTCN